jgi:hypothetical protein
MSMIVNVRRGSALDELDSVFFMLTAAWTGVLVLAIARVNNS